MKTNKLISTLLVGGLVATMFIGCGTNGEVQSTSSNNGNNDNTTCYSTSNIAFNDDFMDLSGDWYFNAYRKYNSNSDSLDSITAITPDVYSTWGTVQPGVDWWTEDFDASLGGNSWFAGYAWYVKTFTIDGELPDDNLVLSVGSFDESNEVYLNGQLVGATGINFTEDGIGVYDESNPWEVECAYTVDKELINTTGENTIAVRMCNSSGGGGWYKGPIGFYTATAYSAIEAESNGRFIVETYKSDALNGEEETYRIYLPKEYETSTASYPVLYMLHGINGSGKSYAIDKVDELLDEAIDKNEIEPMIVVLPDDPTKQSFWLDEYGDMVGNDLIAHIDSTYRTIADSDHRYIGGCSMGGGGAFSIFSQYPEKFSGVISFYGALSYVDADRKITNLPDEALDGKLIYMACGDKDMYAFYNDEESMDQILTNRGVTHYHEISPGEHNSAFYLPRFIDAIKYVTGQ